MTVAALVALLGLAASPAAATVYVWKEPPGTLVITNEAEAVPPEARDSVVTHETAAPPDETERRTRPARAGARQKLRQIPPGEQEPPPPPGELGSPRTGTEEAAQEASTAARARKRAARVAARTAAAGTAAERDERRQRNAPAAYGPAGPETATSSRSRAEASSGRAEDRSARSAARARSAVSRRGDEQRATGDTARDGDAPPFQESTLELLALLREPVPREPPPFIVSIVRPSAQPLSTSTELRTSELRGSRGGGLGDASTPGRAAMRTGVAGGIP